MKKDRSVKQRLFSAILVLVMLFTSLLGTTFAWFTDQVSSAGNQIVSGTLKVDLSVKGENDQWVSLKQNPEQPIFDYKHWEPGYTRVEQLKVDNLGTLALKYQLSIEVALGTADIGENNAKLSDVIDVYVADGEKTAGSFADITAANGWTRKGTLTEVMEKPSDFVKGQLNADGKENDNAIVTIALHMQESAGNEYQGLSAGDIFVNLIATQATVESDSFGTDYDDKAEFPEIDIDDLAIEVEVEGGLVKATKSASRAGISITVPVGVMVDGVTNGTATLVLSVDEKAESEANVTLDDDEILQPLDVHVEGVSAQNQKAIVITIEKAMPTGLNMGNYKLYHVENGATNVMTSVDAAGVDAHNEFYYDPATGDTTLGLATFSEVAMVAEPAAWEGGVDHSWYVGKSSPYVIANADQLWSFSQIVGGMAEGIEQDGFKDKTVKLIADVNLGDEESKNNPDIIFYPIGYNSDDGKYEKTGVAVSTGFYSFMGTFDGNGHTVSNFYQNTWEMKGDHNWYDATLQYYRDGMGLFGKVYGGTVKNLTVKNFSSDGEIATTGVIAAYADGATFENIAIFNCNPRVYNIGNGGIVGCVGWYAKEANLKTTFKNITVDNSNKISALWGSYDVACGGIVGQYYPTSGQSSANYPVNAGVHFENCHVSAIMDVYNDVCANYQYYAYRYTGMLIGSVRENETIDGHVYPKMDGITASGCTVHFGTWNDYYYCEIIDNTTASYTHDYQMSRLTEIKEINGTTITYLDGTTGTVPASGRANYVIVDYTKGHGTENATCYHFKDGAVWTHDMGGIQTGIDENGDGQDDLKEDKQHIYLEFNNLVTGYGWGVTSRGFANLDGVKNLDIEQGDHEESINKFKPVDGFEDEIVTGETLKIEKLFAAIENLEVGINAANVQVTVSPFGATSTAGGTYVANTTDWTQGTLTFSGVGQAVISITDYYFCKTTTITVNIIAADKFDTKFVNYKDYLYRVGNQNTVALGTIFKELNDTVTIDSSTVEVAFATVAGTASATFTENTSDWTTGTIQFSGTGVVMVTVSEAEAVDFVLYLEVVDAYNVITYSELKERNSVLLADITMSSGGTYRLTGNKVLYGNGFTFDVKQGAYAGVAYDYASYVIYLESSRLDNVKIEGAVYPEVGATKSDDYNRAIVMVSGDSLITNSFISNGASPIRNGGNLELVNTTLKGGAYANLDLRNGHLILDNVTTINQANANDKYNDTTVVVGMGIVVYQEGGSDTLKITIRNGLTQYNYLSKTEADEYFTDTYSNAVKNVVFGNDFEDYKNQDLINFGIISMNNYVTAEDIIDERSDKTGYFGTAKTITLLGNSRNCYVYSVKPTTTSAPEYSGYQTAGQGVITPTVDFDFDVKNYVAKTEGSNDYCYADGNTVYISMDEGEAFVWDTSILTATKNGNALNYTVKIDDVDYTGKSITFNTTDTHTVTYTYTDNYNYTLENGNVVLFDEEYSVSIIIEVSVVKAAAKHAEFSFGANGTAYSAKTVTIGDKTYVMPNVTATVDGKIGSTTVNGTTVYYPITEMYTSDGKTAHTGSWYACFPIFKDALQIIDYADQGTGDPVTYNQTNVTTVAGIPSTLKATNPTSAFLYSMNATNYPPPTDPTAVSGAVCYTCNRNGLTSGNARDEMTIFAEYTYTDNAGTVYYFYIGYHCAAQTKGSTPCVTPDTLVTLADGTQKRIDQVTYDDQLLVWNFYTGEYDVASASILMNHGANTVNVTTLYFSDGTSINTINGHGFFDVATNEFVLIDEFNAADYIGHTFVRQDGDGYATVELVSYSVEEQYTEVWSILTSEHYNCMLEGMWTVTAAEVENSPEWLMPYEIGEDMKYDEVKMQADIEKYGLYTYEDFADYCTYEQFVALGLENFKVSVAKGYITWAEIEYLLSIHIK